MTKWKHEPSEAQQAQMMKYLEQGYTMAVVLEDGSLCPGYSDWAIEWELDMRDLREAAQAGVSCVQSTDRSSPTTPCPPARLGDSKRRKIAAKDCP